MAKGYSNDLRTRVVGMVEAGESRRESARVLDLAASTAVRRIKRRTSTGSVAAAVRAVDATVRYLPAYPPDLNTIEMAFAKLKAALRKGATRTVKALWKLIGKLVKEFAPEECATYFQHAGYG